MLVVHYTTVHNTRGAQYVDATLDQLHYATVVHYTSWVQYLDATVDEMLVSHPALYSYMLVVHHSSVHNTTLEGYDIWMAQ